MIYYKEDGITHINIYSRGKTALGRFLSNFAHTPIEINGEKFESVEGYWYWLLADPVNDRRPDLKELYGYEAKKLGKSIRYHNEENIFEFRDKIYIAFLTKINKYPIFKITLIVSDLPLVHYYVFGNKVIEPRQHQWITDMWEKIRENLKAY